MEQTLITDHTITITPDPNEKEKNPLRVAQGKRLSEMSRKAKLAATQRRRVEQPIEQSDTELHLPSLMQASAAVGIVVGILSLYPLYISMLKQSEPPQPADTEVSPQPADTKVSPPKLLVLDSEL